MKKLTVLAVAAGLYIPVASAQTPQVLTFDEALNMALTNNPSVKAAAYEEQAAEREKKAAFGLRLPTANLTGAYAYMSEDIAIDMNGLKDPVRGIIGSLPEGLLPPAVLQQASGLLSQNWAMPLQDRSTGTVGASLTIPVYTGGKINAANNAAKIKVNEAKQSGFLNRNALVSELTERYFGLSLALQVVEVRKQVLEGMQQHLSDARALESNGIIARAERLYAEMHTAEAEQEYIKAQKTVETLNSALANTLNSEHASFLPASSLFLLEGIEQADYFKTSALEQSPLLKQVALKRDLAWEGVRLQRSQFAPQVALMGMASLYNYQVTPLIPRWAVGAGVSFKIFDGLHREYKFSAAKSQVRQVDALKTKAHNDILTLIDKLYNEMTTYNRQMPSIDAAKAFAVEYLRIKEEAFKEGVAPSSDVVDARLNLAKIKIERLQTAYYYDLMLARLLEACGLSETLPEYAKRSTAVPVTYE